MTIEYSTYSEVIATDFGLTEDPPESNMALNIVVYKKAKREAGIAAAPWNEIMARAKEIIGSLLPSLPDAKWKGDVGYAYIPSDGVSVKYDAKALDRLCASNPALAQILSPYRKETTRKGHLTIR